MEGIKRNLPPAPGTTDSLEVKYTKGYHDVRLYRKDIQAIGDSIHYFSVDSLIKLFGSPILWNDSTQLKGDTIYAHLANDTIDHAFAWPNASTVRWIDSVKQDRVKVTFAKARSTMPSIAPTWSHATTCSRRKRSITTLLLRCETRKWTFTLPMTSSTTSSGMARLRGRSTRSKTSPMSCVR